MIRNVTPTYSDVRTWVRAAADAINSLIMGLDGTNGRVSALEAGADALALRVTTAEGDIDAAEAAVTALTGRVDVLEAPETIKFTPVAEPASPEAGWVYFDSSSEKLRCYDGAVWNDLF